MTKLKNIHPGEVLLEEFLLPLNISVKAFYFTLRFAEIISKEVYQQITDSDIIFLMGEWVFAEALYGAATLDKEGYSNDILRRHSPAYNEIPILAERRAQRHRI